MCRKIFLSLFCFYFVNLCGVSLSDKDATLCELFIQPVLSSSIESISVHPQGTLRGELKEGIEVVDFPGDRDCLERELQRFLSLPATQDRFDEIKKVVIQAYQTACRPVVAVFLPEQDFSCGHLDVVVLEGRVGSIEAVGNRFTSCKRLLNQVNLNEGDSIDTRSLFTSLAWWNRTPFRYTEVVLSPGDSVGSTNLELVTKDRLGIRPYAGADNTGNDETGIARIFAGVQTALIWDQQFSYQFTTSVQPKKFYAHSGNYLIPFFWRHQFQAFGGYSKIHAKSASTGMESTGSSIQASGRYEIPFNPIYGSFLHHIRFGYDYKKTNNDLAFGGDTFSSASPEINQFMVGYYLDLKGKSYLLSSNTEVFFSPANLTPNQTNADFQLLRPLSKSKYVYGRTRLSYTQFLPFDFSVAGVGALQLANQNLLPSEQLGLGGYETVRGYEEREVNGDNGALLSLEFRAAPIRPIQWWVNRKIRDEWLFYAFIDYGYAWEHKAVPDTENTFWLLGVGPGTRYSLGTNIDLRADFGFPLHSTGLGRNSLGRWDLGVTISY